MLVLWWQEVKCGVGAETLKVSGVIECKTPKNPSQIIFLGPWLICRLQANSSWGKTTVVPSLQRAVRFGVGAGTMAIS